MAEIDPKYLLSTKSILDLITNNGTELESWIGTRDSIFTRGITVSLASLMHLHNQVKTLLNSSGDPIELKQAEDIYYGLETLYIHFFAMGCILPIEPEYDEYARYKLKNIHVKPVNIGKENSINSIYEKITLATAIIGVDDIPILLVTSKEYCDYSLITQNHNLAVYNEIY